MSDLNDKQFFGEYQEHRKYDGPVGGSSYTLCAVGSVETAVTGYDANGETVQNRLEYGSRNIQKADLRKSTFEEGDKAG